MSEIRLTRHAVGRYQERVKPALSFRQAEMELEACVAAHAEMRVDAPDWIWKLPPGVPIDEELREDFELVAMIGADIAVPLVRHGRHLFAVTVLTRSGLPEGARAYRNRHRRAVKARRRNLRQKHHERAMAKVAKRSGKARREAA